MAKVEVQVEQWQERAIQVLVLLSFVLQLVLLVLAEFRRRIESGVLRAVIWSAYMLADSTAIYTLGHLSVTSRSSNHELMAFWAPFLLVHLGGQDNITAYAIEDNRLWLRHLQALVVQVAAATYVLYESTVVRTQALLRNASILMFVVGVLKYGERVWALKRAGASNNNYRSFETARTLFEPHTDRRDTEGLMWIAYLLLDVPKDLLQGPLPYVGVYFDKDNDVVTTDEVYKIVEMQLSLMHDVVYSKAEVIHTWYGLCIRVISPVFTALALVLFHRSGLLAGNHYSRADVVITYVLLGGAITLEMVSVLRAMFSRWRSVILGKVGYDIWGHERRVWGLLARAIASLRRSVLPERDWSRWWWSCSIGQHNLIDLCVRSRASRTSRFAGWMGVEDWWNTMVYSSSIPVSTTIKELVLKQVVRSSRGAMDMQSYHYFKSREEPPDHIINSRGGAALKKWGSYGRLRKYVDMEFDNSILVWHIATDIYLRWHKDHGQGTVGHVCCVVEATKAISNYMVFLLAARPYMLPGSVSRTRYVELCYCLISLEYDRTMGLADVHGNPGCYSQRVQDVPWNDTILAAHELARDLVDVEYGQPAVKLEMIAEVWMEMMCYAGYRCSGYSHAKQLSNGGELLTAVALVVEYYRRNVLKPWSRAEEKEEEERRAAILRVELLSPSRSSLEAPLDLPRSASFASDEIIDVPVWLWNDELGNSSSEFNGEISPV